MKMAKLSSMIHGTSLKMENLLNPRDDKMFAIKYEINHYAIYKDDVFYCSADTYHEAEYEIEEAA